MKFRFYIVSAAVFLAANFTTRAASSGGSISEVPFAPHPFPRGKTMFVLLPSEQTGIKTENNYTDPRMWGDLYQEFESGSLGTGVAVGDYDGDGRPDLFVTSKTEGCRLFRNLGNFKFEDVTAKAGVGGDPKIWKQGVTFVDINNDGLLDIYVCQFNAPNLLYINQGDGTFKEEAHAYGLDITDASVMAAFCDYDRDGWLDVYITTNLADSVHHPKGQRGYLLHNNRNGTFTNVTELAGISGEAQSHSATWWDFDNDGWPDLYVANDYGVPDKLYHNNKDGTFTEVIDVALPHTSFYSMGSDAGDVDNDGLIDLCVADMAASTHEKDQRSVAESRNKAEDPINPSSAPKMIRSALYLNTGLGRAREGAYLAGIAATDWTWSVRFEDVDNDGWLDFLVTNGFNRDPNPDMHQKSIEAETTAERIRNMYNSPVLNETHFAFRNLGNLQFENDSAAWGLDQKGVSFGAAFGDFGGDGNMDLVYTNYQASVSFLRNDNDSGHRVTVDLRGKRSNRFGVGAVVRVESALGQQVRQLILARGYMSSSEPNLHFGLGADTAIKRLTVDWPSGAHQVFENLGVDRRFTITEPDDVPAQPPTYTPPAKGMFSETSKSVGLQVISAEEPVDELYLQKLLPERLNRRGPALAIGALAPNEDESVFVGGTTVSRATLLKAAGGTFAAVDTSSILPVDLINDGPALIFDANGDGANDLLVTKGGNSQPPDAPEYQPKLFLNDGRGNLHLVTEALPPLTNNVGAAVAADFSRNGFLGLFLGGRVRTGEYPTGAPSALLLNRGGKFEDVTDSFAPELRNVGMVTSALWTDVDGDGWVDLLITLEWGKVRYFHNNQGKSLEDWTDRTGFGAAGNGWWTSL
ncbi:MAG TPA: CRTAC1 family protein, partial [Opitutaceae bacterium]